MENVVLFNLPISSSKLFVVLKLILKLNYLLVLLENNDTLKLHFKKLLMIELDYNLYIVHEFNKV